MEDQSNAEKCRQIRKWVNCLLNDQSEVYVSEYCYVCHEGVFKTKSLICIMDQVTEIGLLTIDKPLLEVSPEDILSLYKTIS